MRGHVDRQAGDGLGKVESVVEIESAKVVLVGFALTTVLTDDETRHRLQNFGRSVDGADGELRSGDRSFASGRRHADQVFGRVLDLGEVAERLWGRHDDVRARCHQHDHVGLHGGSGRHIDGPPHHAEVNQPNGQLRGSSRHAVEPIRAGSISNRFERFRRTGGFQFDRDSRKDASGRIGNGASHRPGSLGPRRCLKQGHQGQNPQQSQQSRHVT